MTGYRPYPVPDGSFAGQTILLTDGDDPVSRGLAAAFAALGGDVFVAAEGETAVSAFDRFERPIDILVNCRWQRTLGPAEDMPPAQAQSEMHQLFGTAFDYSTEFARRRQRAQLGGSILMLTETADLGMPGLSISAAASAAIQNLARSLAAEWAADNIRCNVVACGMIEGRDDPAFAMAAQRGIAPGDTVPTGQIGTVADVVAAALYLCSAYGVYFSGTTMTIDGGENLRHSLGGPPFLAPRTRMLNRQPREVRARQ